MLFKTFSVKADWWPFCSSLATSANGDFLVTSVTDKSLAALTPEVILVTPRAEAPLVNNLAPLASTPGLNIL